MNRLVLCVVLALSCWYQASAETLKVSVESAEAGPDLFTRDPVVTLMLKPESKSAMAEFTRARVGEQIKVRLGDRVLMESVINEPILAGTLVINGRFDEQAARELADAIMKASGTFEIDGSDK